MRHSLPARLLLLGSMLVAVLFVRASVTAAAPVVAAPLSPGATQPWAMAGCWEHELFIPKTVVDED